MRKHLAGALLAAAVLATACTSPGSPQASQSASPSSSAVTGQSRYTQLIPALVTCFARHGLIHAKNLDGRFYQHGHVVRNLYFDQWWRTNNGLPVKVNGTWMHLDEVVLNAVTKGSWPAKICGPMPSPSGGPLPPSPAAS